MLYWSLCTIFVSTLQLPIEVKHRNLYLLLNLQKCSEPHFCNLTFSNAKLCRSLVSIAPPCLCVHLLSSSIGSLTIYGNIDHIICDIIVMCTAVDCIVFAVNVFFLIYKIAILKIARYLMLQKKTYGFLSL